MTVEVVGHDDSKKLKATCKNCGAKLEFYRQDVTTQTLWSMNEYAGSYEFVICPTCEKQVDIKS